MPKETIALLTEMREPAIGLTDGVLCGAAREGVRGGAGWRGTAGVFEGLALEILSLQGVARRSRPLPHLKVKLQKLSDTPESAAESPVPSGRSRDSPPAEHRHRPRARPRPHSPESTPHAPDRRR